MKNRNRKKYKNKLSFWRFDNVLFLSISVVCIIIWSCIYYVELFEIDDIAVSLTSAILSAALIPLGLNFGKYTYEKKRLKAICKSIIDLSVFLVGDLNAYLIKNNKPLFLNLEEININEKFNGIDFKKIKTLDDLFDLISTRLSQIVKMEYVKTDDNFEYVVEKATSSTRKALVDVNYSKLYRDLYVVIKIIGTIKPSLMEKCYIEVFNQKVDKNIQNLKNNFCGYTDEYIVKCIENDLFEKIDNNNN